MAAFTNFLEQKLLEHTFRNVSWTSPSGVYLALYTAAPGETGGGTEVANSSAYARQAISFSAYSSGSVKNASDITFPIATGNWGTITHVAIWDSQTYGAGNMLAYGALAASKVVDSGGIFKVLANDLTVSLD